MRASAAPSEFDAVGTEGPLPPVNASCAGRLSSHVPDVDRAVAQSGAGGATEEQDRLRRSHQLPEAPAVDHARLPLRRSQLAHRYQLRHRAGVSLKSHPFGRGARQERADAR